MMQHYNQKWRATITIYIADSPIIEACRQGVGTKAWIAFKAVVVGAGNVLGHRQCNWIR
jgi:hypothetical protein